MGSDYITRKQYIEEFEIGKTNSYADFAKIAEMQSKGFYPKYSVLYTKTSVPKMVSRLVIYHFLRYRPQIENCRLDTIPKFNKNEIKDIL